MTLEEKKTQLIATLTAIKNQQERFSYIVSCGRKSVPLPDAFKTDIYRVEGCMAKLWFVSEFKEGKCYYKIDSDSAIVKGIAVILADFYSGQSPEAITSIDPSFLEKVGITQHLTPNRRNSLGRVWEKIRGFAQAQLTHGNA